MRHAFHQAAVTGDDPGLVVDEIVTETGIEVAFGHGHANGGGQSLTERAGGAFDTGGVTVFRMAGGGGAPLAEVLDVFHRYRLEAGEVKQRVEQHRTVTGGEHETVAVGPVRLLRVVLQELGPQHGGDVGHAHRHALVAGLRVVNCLHRQDADRVGHQDTGWFCCGSGCNSACGHG